MFIWLASYPKSGNTLLRAMLSAYFFSDDGKFNFELIKFIKQFPQAELFEKLNIDLNFESMVQNYIKVQESINIKNSIQFVKTHSAFFNINNHRFTDYENSLGVIYIVRDPRNVVTSFSKFNGISIEESTDYLINENYLEKGHPLNPSKNFLNYSGTWKYNYNSWKEFKSQRKYLLVKYEDLVDNKKIILIKIIKFIFNLKKIKPKINLEKLDNIIESTSFENMQLLEKRFGFNEAIIDPLSGERRQFFNMGKKNKWQEIINEKVKKKIENSFKKEMNELNYL